MNEIERKNFCRHRWREISREEFFSKTKIVYVCIDCGLEVKRIYYKKENEK